MSNSLQPYGLYNPWNSPGQNTGVCSHFFHQGILTNPGMDPRSPTLQVDSLPAEPPGKPKNTGVDSLSLLQQIFSTQESNRGHLYCRWILYQLSYQGSCIAFRKSSVNIWNAPRLRVNKILPRWRVAREVAFPSFHILTYSTKVSGATSLGTSSAHQGLFLFFFLEVEDPLAIDGPSQLILASGLWTEVMSVTSKLMHKEQLGELPSSPSPTISSRLCSRQSRSKWKSFQQLRTLNDSVRSSLLPRSVTDKGHGQ